MPLENLNGLTSIFVAGYIAAVVYNGNAQKLFNELKTETGYLEFAIALALIYYLVMNKYTGDITSMFVLAAAVAMTLKIMINLGDTTIFQEFAQGKRGLFSTAGALFGVNN